MRKMILVDTPNASTASRDLRIRADRRSTSSTDS
jgi:hypothetical protein